MEIGQTSGKDKNPKTGFIQEIFRFNKNGKIMDKLKIATKNDLKSDVPEFRSGDTVAIGVTVREGNRTRIQMYEGVVIAISSGGGIDKTFTVRKISNGIGVERIFPLHSPNIDSIKVIKQGKVRRAKLYYLRDRKGKASRIKERL